MPKHFIAIMNVTNKYIFFWIAYMYILGQYILREIKNVLKDVNGSRGKRIQRKSLHTQNESERDICKTTCLATKR